jgi:hypothetical protein
MNPLFALQRLRDRQPLPGVGSIPQFLNRSKVWILAFQNTAGHQHQASHDQLNRNARPSDQKRIQ